MPCLHEATRRVNETMPCPNKAMCRVNKASCRLLRLVKSIVTFGRDVGERWVLGPVPRPHAHADLAATVAKRAHQLARYRARGIAALAIGIVQFDLPR
jgi:hypothetical protein